MKKYYRLGGDLFVACAFTASIIGGVLKILQMAGFGWVLTPIVFLRFSAMCLLFSIALSLLDIAQRLQQ